MIATSAYITKLKNKTLAYPIADNWHLFAKQIFILENEVGQF